MRIAQITNLTESVPPLNKNGLEQVVSYLTEELVNLGHEVTLFATADSKTAACLVPLWPMATSRDPLGQKLTPETYGTWSVSAAFGRHQEFDIIHDHTRYTAAHFAKLIPTPVVSTIHHPISFEQSYSVEYPPEYQPYFAQNWEANREAVHTVVVSAFQAKQYPDKCEVIHNGLPINDWPFVEKPGDYFAFLGYINQDKGVLEAIKAVLPTNQKLLIAGVKRGNEVDIDPFLNSRIQYVGPLDHEQKKKFLGGALATLMPIQWDEPFGMVAIESLACGTPVIAWNRAAMPEIITDGINGFLVDSVEEMTAKIIYVGAHHDAPLRARCRKTVEDRFTAKIMAEKYVELYKKLL